MDTVAWTLADKPHVGIITIDSNASGGTTTTDTTEQSVTRPEPVSETVQSGPISGDDSTQSTQQPPVTDIISSIERTVTTHGGTTTVGSPSTVVEENPSLLVAIGDLSVRQIVRELGPIDIPVLPVETSAGLDAVRETRVQSTINTLFDGPHEIVRRAILSVHTPSNRTERALLDATLVTDEPARISEYSLHQQNQTISQFRADGIVIATPAGSHGYASAAGGPLLADEIDGIVSVPIAPFVMQARRWILPLDTVELSVIRDEGDVVLILDGESIETIPAGSSISIEHGGWLRTISPHDSE